MRVTALLSTEEVQQIIADALGVPEKAVCLTPQGARVTLAGCTQVLGFAGLAVQTKKERQSQAGETLQRIVEDSMIRNGPADDTGGSLTAEIPRQRYKRKEIGAGPSGYKRM